MGPTVSMNSPLHVKMVPELLRFMSTWQGLHAPDALVYAGASYLELTPEWGFEWLKDWGGSIKGHKCKRLDV